MVVVLGIDPDTRNTGWAVVSAEAVLAVGVVRSTGTEQNMLRVTGVVLEGLLQKWAPALVVVEGQKIYSGVKTAPNDILTLGQIAGGILGQVLVLSPTTNTCFPDPQGWKGQLPKPVEQGRTFTHYGILFKRNDSYCWPSGCVKSAAIQGAGMLNRGDWKHVADAVGLARHGVKLLTGER